VNARLARSKGCRFVIDTDAHAVGQLENIRFGIFQARRAGLTADDVWNTQPFERFRDGLLARRGRGTTAHAATKPAPKPPAKPAPKPAPKQAAKPAAKPAARPSARPVARPAAKTAAARSPKSAAKPSARPAKAAAVKPAPRSKKRPARG
jgi:hypothetical protein